MTPKEKAEQLFSEYRAILSIPDAPLGEYKDKVAKNCAILLIEELRLHVGSSEKLYWFDVKKEIEKL